MAAGFFFFTQNNMTTIIVYNENTFGYTEEELNPAKAFCKMWILSVQSIKGGEPLLLGNCILANTEKVRLATKQDFEDYKISIKGYLRPEYTFKKH